MTRIGVVTVTHNSVPVLDDFLSSVWSQAQSDFLLFIVDSGSTDGTQEQLRVLRDPRARTVFLEQNRGFAAGCNIGIKMALEEGCDAVLLLNNDTAFPPDLFRTLAAGMDRYNCDMTTPKMLYFNPQAKIWAAGGHLNRWLGYRNRHDGADCKDDGRFNAARRVTFTPFCCILMRREAVRKLGELDENYFVYTEDADYCLRALKANLSLWYLPDAKLWHKVSSLTGGAETPFLIRYCTRNRAYFLHKHLPPWLAWFWTTAYRFYYFSRWVIGKDTRQVWRTKREVTREGIRMARNAALQPSVAETRRSSADL